MKWNPYCVAMPKNPNPQWVPPPRREPFYPPIRGVVRPRVVPPANRPGRRTNLLEEMMDVLQDIWDNPNSTYFQKPIDAFAMGIPDYHLVVLFPMDLCTIRKRLVNNYYWQADEVVEDFELMFKNCMLYHPEGSPPYVAANELRHDFYARLALVDKSSEVELKPGDEKKKRKSAAPEHSSPPVKRALYEVPTNKSAEHNANSGDNYVLDRLHCGHLLKTLRSEKYSRYTWPFDKEYLTVSSNPNYNARKRDILDWAAVERNLLSDRFKGISEFVATMWKMFENALECFQLDPIHTYSVKVTREIFESLLPRYRKQIVDAKMTNGEYVPPNNAITFETHTTSSSQDPLFYLCEGPSIMESGTQEQTMQSPNSSSEYSTTECSGGSISSMSIESDNDSSYCDNEVYGCEANELKHPITAPRDEDSILDMHM
ncbi:bromodomain-containing factor 1-like [Scaptodrosophila lebanonensis]|uniref:Bromodomain-containing factor 1-like n=1 Tax=Drosophila lebanonensis TaxID=7225 RepID=A0A6J2TZH9_DROLE|nr:bromodomain-containing factor 1-like [Scaptodrosophila lebanonensis]